MPYHKLDYFGSLRASSQCSINAMRRRQYRSMYQVAHTTNALHCEHTHNNRLLHPRSKQTNTSSFIMKSAMFLVYLGVLLSTSLAAIQMNAEETLGSEIGRVSTFFNLLDFSGLSSTLDKLQHVTILVPTNVAFRAAARSCGCRDLFTQQAVLTCFKTQGVERVRTLLRNHVLSPSQSPPERTGDRISMTLSGTILSAKRLRNISKRSTFPIAKPGRRDVQIINSVLLPSIKSGSSPRFSLSTVLEDATKFKILLAILEKVGTMTTLERMENQTLFAPTDYAFRMSAREIGCASFESDEAIVDCFTGQVPSNFGPMPFDLKYHILPGAHYLAEMLYSHVFTMSNGIPVYRKGIYFVDQVPALQNARLKVELYDIPYNSGVVHALHRVMLPFTSVPPPRACDVFEYPFSVANASFVPIYMLIKGVSRCEAVRYAILACDLDETQVCKSGRGATEITKDITVGHAVSAAKNCKAVFEELESCGKVRPPSW